MKIFTAVATVISFVIIMILAFENFQASCNYLTFFFWELSASTSPTFTLFGAAMVGIFTGVTGTMFFNSMFGAAAEEEEEQDEDFQV
jgi:uncharacterized integral membrane protein